MDAILLLQSQVVCALYNFVSNSRVFMKWGSETLIWTNYQINFHFCQLTLLCACKRYMLYLHIQNHLANGALGHKDD